MIQVKICGITNIEDAFAAADAGADMLGYNFYVKSPRCISTSKCLKIQHALHRSGRRLKTVAVFVNCPPVEIQTILEDCGIDYAQLSGDEQAADLQALGERAFKGIRPQNAAEAERLAADFANPHIRPALLLDAYHPVQYGGTGTTADFDLAANIAARFPILLAGGLTPGNAAAAVTRTKPWGLDVASGVESAPGKKDHHKIRQFVQAAKTPLHHH